MYGLGVGFGRNELSGKGWYFVVVVLDVGWDLVFLV